MSEHLLRFDEPSHTYWLGDRQVPGTTTVLGLLGGYEGIPARILQKAATRGTAVHKITELEDAGTLDYATLDDELSGYLEAWWRFKDDHKPQILDAEVPGYHPTLLYAGTRDRRLALKKKAGILDIKSSYRLMPSTGPQTAAYKEIYNANVPKSEQLKHRWGLKLARDGTYELKEYTDHAGDFNTFVSALNCWRFIEKHNAKLQTAIEEMTRELD